MSIAIIGYDDVGYLARVWIREGTVQPKMLDSYTIVIRPDDNGTFVAYVPAIDGCHAWGRTPEEARAELVNVFAMMAAEYAEAERPLPSNVELTIVRAR